MCWWKRTKMRIKRLPKPDEVRRKPWKSLRRREKATGERVPERFLTYMDWWDNR